MSLSSSVTAAVCSSVLTLILYLSGGDRRGHRLGADLHQVVAAAQQRLLVHPHDGRLELIGDLGGLVGRDEQVAAADVDLVVERDRDRLPRDRLVQIAVEGDDARDAASVRPRAATRTASPFRNRPRDDRPGEAAKILVGPIHPLDRQTQRLPRRRLVDLDAVERPISVGPWYQGSRAAVRRCCRRYGRDRDAGDVGRPSSDANLR